MTSLHSLLARLKQFQAELERDPAPYVPAERLVRQRIEIENDIVVLEDLIRSLASEAERQEQAA